MNKINIVIPMAGVGSRFLKEGFMTAKPFITFNGKMMIEHVLDSINIENANYFLIIQDEFKLLYKEQLLKIEKDYKVILLSVKELTQGAACTVLFVHEKINNNQPLLILDSDNLYIKNILKNFINYALSSECDGALLTFDSDEPLYSYVQLNKKKSVIKIKEKEVISNFAICGAYFYSKGKYFVNSIINNLIYKNKQKNEYYISGTYQFLINSGKKIINYQISITDWNCVGTPKQLEEYLRRIT